MLPIISLKEKKGTIYAYNIKGVRIYKKRFIISYDSIIVKKRGKKIERNEQDL